VTTLRQSADTDALTGRRNHAFFSRAAQRRFEKAQEHGLPLSLIMLDIDNFKSYNDRFGHEAGNVVLSVIAHILRESVRADDIVARYGGEEFAVVMSDDLEYAVNIAERIRVNVKTQCTSSHDHRLRDWVTVSLGVAARRETTESMGALIEAADEQMYRAKNVGKNRVKAEAAEQTGEAGAAT